MNTQLEKDMAVKINELHEKANLAMMDTVSYATEIGELLSVKKEELAHGEFSGWVTDNLDFSLRTAQSYIKIFKHRDELERFQPTSLAEAYRLIAPEKPTRAVDDEEEEEDSGEITDADFSIVEEEKLPTGYEYWPIMEKVRNEMMIGYTKLSAMRNHTTPKALGFMIGNIAEMAARIQQWAPDKVTRCPSCNGSGQIKDTLTDQVTTCSLCINGAIGPFKETNL